MRNKIIYQIKYKHIASTFVPSFYGSEIKNQAAVAFTTHQQRELLGMMYDIDQLFIGKKSKTCLITKRANNFAKHCKQNQEKYINSCTIHKENMDKLYCSILKITDPLPLDLKIIILNKIKLS